MAALARAGLGERRILTFSAAPSAATQTCAITNPCNFLALATYVYSGSGQISQRGEPMPAALSLGGPCRADRRGRGLAGIAGISCAVGISSKAPGRDSPPQR